jgi:hypothetical protein
MCDRTHGGTNIDEMIKALIDGKASPLEISRGKNTLFLVLDNARPVPITRVLLDGVIWKHINNKDNVYVVALSLLPYDVCVPRVFPGR